MSRNTLGFNRPLRSIPTKLRNGRPHRSGTEYTALRLLNADVLLVLFFLSELVFLLADVGMGIDIEEEEAVDGFFRLFFFTTLGSSISMDDDVAPVIISAETSVDTKPPVAAHLMATSALRILERDDETKILRSKIWFGRCRIARTVPEMLNSDMEDAQVYSSG